MSSLKEQQLGMSFIQEQQLPEIYYQQQYRHNQRQRSSLFINKNHKALIILALIIVFLSYRYLYQGQLEKYQCIRDYTHSLTQSINKKLNQDGDFSYYFLILGQLFVDLNMISFIIYQMFKTQNFFITAWIGIFYGIRAGFLNIQKFPYPQNVYWDQPGFPPSIGVPYGITSDYFYSGHTGLMLFSIRYWSQKEQTVVMKYIAWVGFPYIILLVLSSRVHYISDVFAAVFYCLWIYQFVKKYLSIIDAFFSKGYSISIYFLSYIETWLMFILRLKRNRRNDNNEGILI